VDREILIQEEYLDNPWKMLVCCILLNQTNNRQVRPLLKNLFEIIPDPKSALNCESSEIATLIKTTGFQNVKADRIKKMSAQWIAGFEKIDQLPGIGKYGKESWEIFVNGNLGIEPSDKKLKAYLEAIR
jgi:methyl-CpG-binding domain protein 4